MKTCISSRGHYIHICRNAAVNHQCYAGTCAAHKVRISIISVNEQVIQPAAELTGLYREIMALDDQQRLLRNKNKTLFGAVTSAAWMLKKTQKRKKRGFQKSAVSHV